MHETSTKHENCELKSCGFATSFNKSDDKSKKLEEQSKSGDARERERRQRYDG